MEWLPKAIERCSRELGPTHRLTLQSRYRLLDAANHLGDLEAAEAVLPPLLRDLRAARARSIRRCSPSRSRTRRYVHAKRGREAESIAALEEALAVADAPPRRSQRGRAARRGSRCRTT